MSESHESLHYNGFKLEPDLNENYVLTIPLGLVRVLPYVIGARISGEPLEIPSVPGRSFNGLQWPDGRLVKRIEFHDGTFEEFQVND